MQRPSAVTVLSCGISALGLGGAQPAAGETWQTILSWQPAVRLDAVSLPAPVGEGCPIETPDGLSLMFASNRSGFGNNDIYTVDRDDAAAPWQSDRVQKLAAPINDDFGNDFCPMPFGRSLLFVSDRAAEGTCGNVLGGAGDIYLSRQTPAGNWTEPEHLACAPKGPNTPGGERSPSLVETSYGTFLFYSTNGAGGDSDIFVSRMRDDGTFGPGEAVESLSSPYDDFMPNVRESQQNGFEIVFSSSRPTPECGAIGSCGSQDVFGSVAWRLPNQWLQPVNLGGDINTAGAELRATLSRDGKRLVFGRNGDLYMSERE